MTSFKILNRVKTFLGKIKKAGWYTKNDTIYGSTPSHDRAW